MNKKELEIEAKKFDIPKHIKEDMVREILSDKTKFPGNLST